MTQLGGKSNSSGSNIGSGTATGGTLRYMLEVLNLLDLFFLWGWVLVGLGAARIGRKESWAGAAVIAMVIPVTMAAVIAIFTR